MKAILSGLVQRRDRASLLLLGEEQVLSKRRFIRREDGIFCNWGNTRLAVTGAMWENHGREDHLLLEGDVGHAFFIIVAGQVKVMKDGKLLNVLKEGDCFGEMAYLSGDRARRTASITAVSEVQLLKIQDVQLEQLSDACQLRFNRVFLKTLIERLAWTSEVLAQVKQ